MTSTSKLTFSVTRADETNFSGRSVEPCIDGSPLSELVGSFERERSYQPAGGYGGLIPTRFCYGPLDKYFLGEYEPESFWGKIGGIYVLCCKCGEADCWPLMCQVQTENNTFLWQDFRQPHRSERDYTKFGPFVFDAHQYRDAVQSFYTHFLNSTNDNP